MIAAIIIMALMAQAIYFIATMAVSMIVKFGLLMLTEVIAVFLLSCIIEAA